MSRMPVLFIGHGSPMNLIEENKWTKNWEQLGKEIERPKGIIMLSAHWYTEGLFITEQEKPKTIYDMYGFPEEIYEIDYKAINKKEIRDRVVEILQPDGVLNGDWGYDHGCYSVLHFMYPKRDIPLLQVSINALGKSNYHYELGKKLKELREEGFLIIGSGNIVHNLYKMGFNGEAFGWAIESDEKINNLVKEKKHEEIIDFEETDKNFKLIAPRPDHYYPFIAVLGATDEKDEVVIFNDDITGMSLSMTSYIWK